MTFNHSDLAAARDAGHISTEQLAALSAFLSERNSGEAAPRFDLVHMLWYAGALIVIGALGLFTTLAFSNMGGAALVACGIIYGLGFLFGGNKLWNTSGLKTPGGLLIAAAVSMVPMIIYGIQDYFQLWDYAKGDPGAYRNFFPYIHGSWIYMEAATIIAALVASRFYRAPFIWLIGAIALWFLSMDVVIWLRPDQDNWWNYETRRTVSLIFGATMIAYAWMADVHRKGKTDMSFWLHIFGIMAFWGGLSLMDSGSQLGKFIYCMINVGLLALSLFLNRRVYAVFGTLGIAGYLGYLASDLFKDSMLFPIALSAIGLGVIGAGLYLHKNRARLAASFNAMLPAVLQRMRPVTA